MTRSPRRATHRRSVWVIAAVAVLMMLVGLPATAVAREGASLTTTPGHGHYVGGQAITFAGNIGRAGEQRVHLEFNNSTRGTTWTPVSDGRTWLTDARGNFSFEHPAPAMFGIRYRVAARRSATPPVVFDARSQDLVLSAEPSATSALPQDTVVAGEPFTIRVDTTPELAGRPDTPAPAFPGRTLTLQRRVAGDRWETLRTTLTDQGGFGAFEGLVIDSAGSVVYRVRQEDYTRGGHRIGWFPSFPTYVRAVSARGAAAAPAPLTDAVRAARAVSGETATGSTSRLRGTSADSAAVAWDWRPALFDFAWEFGESLTDPPRRGSVRRGRWIDAADGTGRASHYNGGLMLDSQRDGKVNGAADQSYGTTSATLRGNARERGRWETRLRVKRFESDDAAGTVLLELVPEDPAAEQCGARAITVARFVPGVNRVGVGVRTPKRRRQWTHTVTGVATQDVATAYAVEVGRRHITWFVDGSPVATIGNRAAMPRVPMTLRLSLSGPGSQEFDRTRVISDWQRGYSLGSGRQVKRGHSLRGSRHGYGC